MKRWFACLGLSAVLCSLAVAMPAGDKPAEETPASRKPIAPASATRRAPADAGIQAAPAQQAALAGQAAPAERPMYIVQCKIYQTDAAGNIDVLSRPQVVTLEDQPAVIQVGADVVPPQSLGPCDDLFCGNKARLVVRRGKNRQLVLDASLQLARDQNPPGERVVITHQGVRVVEPILLGLAFAISLPSDPGQPATHCEFTVQDAAAVREAQARRPARK
jgi:hypothetical protein